MCFHGTRWTHEFYRKFFQKNTAQASFLLLAQILVLRMMECNHSWCGTNQRITNSHRRGTHTHHTLMNLIIWRFSFVSEQDLRRHRPHRRSNWKIREYSSQITQDTNVRRVSESENDHLAVTHVSCVYFYLNIQQSDQMTAWLESRLLTHPWSWLEWADYTLSWLINSCELHSFLNSSCKAKRGLGIAIELFIELDISRVHCNKLFPVSVRMPMIAMKTLW